MKLKNGLVLVTLAFFLSILPISAQALSINFDLSFTADQVISMWQVTGDFNQQLDGYDDGNWGQWAKASTYNVSASNFDSFSLIWQIDSEVAGGFLAEITDTGFGTDSVSFQNGSLLSSAAWLVSTDTDNWSAASVIDPQKAPVAGISDTAQWIWTAANDPSVYVRVDFGAGTLGQGTEEVGNFDVTPVPEPGTILLVGAGLVGLAICRRKMKK